MSKKYRIITAIVIGLSVVAYFYSSTAKDQDEIITSKVDFGSMNVEVHCSGELKSEKNKEILGPSSLREIRVYEIKINDLIPEGTVVDSGDYVAKLDQSAVQTKIKDIADEIKKIDNELESSKLDTALQLRGLRDAIVNLNYSAEEAKITLEQSKFESPSTIRQAEISYEKAIRSLKQSEENYKLKVAQAKSKIEVININKARREREEKKIFDVMQSMVIKAPAPGMLIYAKDWNGRKKKVGSNISAWNPVVATLPDLSSMISKTYVNEIDISKVKLGQKVKLGVDAFPEKEYIGTVTNIANIGEQLSGGIAKVFEVEIKINGSDEILRPAMTTSNTILINSFSNILKIPLDGLFSNDSLQYVLVDNGFNTLKKVIKTGEANDNEIIVLEGLNRDEKIRLTAPEDLESLEYSNKDIMNRLLTEYHKKKLKAKVKELEFTKSEKKSKSNILGNIHIIK